MPSGIRRVPLLLLELLRVIKDYLELFWNIYSILELYEVKWDYSVHSTATGRKNQSEQLGARAEDNLDRSESSSDEEFQQQDPLQCTLEKDKALNALHQSLAAFNESPFKKPVT
ncbi:hypothetical protein FQR65_LT02781 [Abscondita terminalis]|nr:hypothetical protein FQR65_LT02781 [Abscondita terminalis]